MISHEHLNIERWFSHFTHHYFICAICFKTVFPSTKVTGILIFIAHLIPQISMRARVLEAKKLLCLNHFKNPATKSSNNHTPTQIKKMRREYRILLVKLNGQFLLIRKESTEKNAAEISIMIWCNITFSIYLYRNPNILVLI